MGEFKNLKQTLTFPTPASCCKIICVFLAIRALNTEGKANASSNEFVCKDWVPPKTAERASTVVLIMLLYGSYFGKETPSLKCFLFFNPVYFYTCAVKLQPDVWQWHLNIFECSFWGLKFFSTKWAHKRRAALSFAISM